MAFNFNKLLAALFFTAVASASIAHGIIMDGANLDIVQVTALGVLTCAIPGSNISGNPIYNATVALTCGNASFTPTKTTVTGAVLLIYNVLNNVLFNSSACTANITMGNLASCTAYPPNLTVPAILEIVNIAGITIGQALQFALSILLPVLSK